MLPAMVLFNVCSSPLTGFCDGLLSTWKIPSFHAGLASLLSSAVHVHNIKPFLQPFHRVLPQLFCRTLRECG